MRRLNDEEQRKYLEIEAIKREKETLIKQAGNPRYGSDSHDRDKFGNP